MARKSAPVVAPIAPIPPQPSNEGFITPKQLAERLHVKVSTIWEWTRRREKNPIPHFPVSKKAVYFRWSEVVRWVEARRVA
jgi:predicted DNA-binding transcriptional regulator AlpA